MIFERGYSNPLLSPIVEHAFCTDIPEIVIRYIKVAFRTAWQPAIVPLKQQNWRIECHVLLDVEVSDIVLLDVKGRISQGRGGGRLAGSGHATLQCSYADLAFLNVLCNHHMDPTIGCHPIFVLATAILGRHIKCLAQIVGAADFMIHRNANCLILYPCLLTCLRIVDNRVISIVALSNSNYFGRLGENVVLFDLDVGGVVTAGAAIGGFVIPNN